MSTRRAGKITVGSVYVHNRRGRNDRRLMEKERFRTRRRWPSGMAGLVAGRRRRGRLRRLEHRSYRERHQAWKANVKEVRGSCPASASGFPESSIQGWVTAWSGAATRMSPVPPVGGRRGKAFDNDAGWRIDYHPGQAGACRTGHVSSVERPAAYAAALV